MGYHWVIIALHYKLGSGGRERVHVHTMGDSNSLLPGKHSDKVSRNAKMAREVW